MKIGLYCRVSTEEQAQGFSIDHQKERMTAYCVSQGWLDYDLYVDEGFTGTNLNRPHLRRLIQHIRERKIQVVLVYKLDRLSRRQKDVLHLLEDIFEPLAVGFRSVTEPFDTSTPFGKAMIGMLAVFAQLERDTIIERTRSGKRQRTQQGLWYGGPVPYGYHWSREKQRLSPNPSQAELIQQVFRQFIAGASYQSLLGWLSERTTERLFSSHKTLVYILSNPVYAGKLNHQGDLVPGQHEPLIDEETWQEAQSELQKRHLKKAPRGKYLLSNLLLCGACGATMKHTHAKDSRGPVVRWRNYYLCSAKHRGQRCASRYYPEQELEDGVSEHVKRLALDPQMVEAELKKLQDQTPSTAEDGLRDILECELQQVNLKLGRWYDAFETGSLDATMLSERIHLLEHEKEAVLLRLRERATLEKSIDQPAEPSLNSLRLVGQQWDQLSPDEQSIILHAAIQQITVYPNGALEIAWNVRD